MESIDIKAVVTEALRAANQLRNADQQLSYTADAPLFGRDGQLDSMALVALLLDIEDALLDEGIELSLSDERAMSEAKSPFRTIDSLTAYIERRLQEA